MLFQVLLVGVSVISEPLSLLSLSEPRVPVPTVAGAGFGVVLTGMVTTVAANEPFAHLRAPYDAVGCVCRSGG